MGYPVVHFEIIGQDANRLRSFYNEAFDWKIDAPIPNSPVEYSLIRPGSHGKASGIDGGIGKAPKGYGGHVTFYVYVPDVAEALKKVESLGGKTMMGPDQVPDGPIIAVFEDIEGHVVGLVNENTQPDS